MNEEEKWGSTVGDYRKASKFPNEIAELEKENPESTKAMVKASKYIAAYIDSLNLSYIPELRFTDFLECSGWEEKALSEVAEIKRGNGLSKSSVAEGGKNPCILYGELFTKYNTVIKSILSYTNESAPVKSKTGDILMPTSDVTPKGLAKASMISIDDVTLGGDMNIIRPNQKLVDSIFLAYAINYFSKKIIDKVSGSSVKHIYASDLKDISYEFPSLPEQKKIAEFFSALDERIALTADKVKLLKEQKTGYLQQVFNRELVFTDDNGDRFPEWEMQSINEAVLSINGGGTPARNEPSFWGGEIPWVTVKDLKDKKYIDSAQETITKKGLASSSASLASPGEIIIPTRMAVGRILISTGSFAINQDLKRIVLTDQFNNEFFYYAFSAQEQKIKELGSGSTVTGINLETLRKIKIPCPSFPEQEKIAEFFSALDVQIERTENKLELLKEQKKGYLQGIFG